MKWFPFNLALFPYPDKLIMPTPPNDIIESDFVFPPEFEAFEVIPLRSGQLKILIVCNGHITEQIIQRHIFPLIPSAFLY